MSAFDDLPKLKREVDGLQREADKAAGAEEQWLRQAKREFGCKSLEEAEAKLLDLGTGERESYKLYNRKMRRFRKRFKRFLRRIRNDGD